MVAFLLSDIEGSTRLWAADPDAMSASLKTHDSVLREAIGSHGGVVFATGGDSFAAAFGAASAAVDAARDAQAALSSADWPGPELRVRIGIHVGEAEERGGDYFGPVVNTTARVEAAGHGGQILITDAVLVVVATDDVTDLGSHRLRDLPEPIHLFQLGSGEFGALRGVQGARDSLPSRRTRLIGRDKEVGELVGLLRSGRIVTVVGPGGIGKTSLAVEAAGKVSGLFPAGAHFVDLASVTDGADVVGAVCRGVRLAAGATPYDELVSFLSGSAALLVIDNCEHVIDDAAEVIDRLLGDLETVSILATSREHLDLDGEQILALGSLEPGGSSAARLFVERVVAVRPDFDPDEHDLAGISKICARLDGLPLAIELAAGRARTMSLAEIEDRLDDRFSLLAGGKRGKLRRQQTLGATLDWSIELLEPEEADLLARLAVYVSGFDTEGAEAVMPAATGDITELVASLAAKSLVQRIADEGSRARYRILETVREWGMEDLSRLQLLREVRDLHAQRYLNAHLQLDVIDLNSYSTALRWEPELADLVAAMTHLCDDDPMGVAIMAAPHGRQFAEDGYGTLALEMLDAGRAAASGGREAQLWQTHRSMQMMMGLEGFYDSWVLPAAVVGLVESLVPPAADLNSSMLRAFGLQNACLSYFHLGRCEEALSAFTE
jgi:predicted ATPase